VGFGIHAGAEGHSTAQVFHSSHSFRTLSHCTLIRSSYHPLHRSPPAESNTPGTALVSQACATPALPACGEVKKRKVADPHTHTSLAWRSHRFTKVLQGNAYTSHISIHTALSYMNIHTRQHTFPPTDPTTCTVCSEGMDFQGGDRRNLQRSVDLLLRMGNDTVLCVWSGQQKSSSCKETDSRELKSKGR
jgi:hypothetical protein